MFNKFLLLEEVVGMLKKREFDVFVTSGCFDIAARREYLLLLKILFNVDSLPEYQALSLRSIAYFLSAHPFVVSLRCTRHALQDDTVYQRFSLPVVTPKLLDMIVTEKPAVVESSKGRSTVEIDTALLRRKRLETNYTLEELAKEMGISKKSLYEIEHKHVSPTIGHVEKLESLLNTNLRLGFRFKQPEPVYLKPKGSFQKKVSIVFNRMGIDNSSICSVLFDLVGKEKLSFVIGLYEDDRMIVKDVENLKEFVSVVSSKALFIAKKSKEKSLEGIPILAESELAETSKKELRKLISAS